MRLSSRGQAALICYCGEIVEEVYQRLSTAKSVLSRQKASSSRSATAGCTGGCLGGNCHGGWGVKRQSESEPPPERVRLHSICKKFRKAGVN